MRNASDGDDDDGSMMADAGRIDHGERDGGSGGGDDGDDDDGGGRGSGDGGGGGDGDNDSGSGHENKKTRQHRKTELLTIH